MSSGAGTPQRQALVVGATGISGGNVARLLLAEGWQVNGLCRRPDGLDERVRPVVADLEDRDAVADAIRGTAPTHVFYTTWSRRPTEAENCEVNGRMLQHLLDATGAEGSVQHVALVTGLKHYLGPFEAYAKVQPDTPFSEEQARLPFENFYYVQEDILFEAAARNGFTWSVHRPHTLIGWALGNAMNMGVTLAVYGAICRETSRPFQYPGSQEQWEAVTDVTDAELLAEHLVWAATTPGAANQALNIVNGDVFRWRRLWPRLATALGVEPAPYNGEPAPLEMQMGEAAAIWPEIVRRHGLHELDVNALASWWHTDADLGRTIETFTDMSRSRQLGFMSVRDTESSFLRLFDRLRAERVVP
jgi:nucleoside-diphosphate-sugar epimerase